MRTPMKLAGFGAGLVLAFGAAAGIGQAAGPTLDAEKTEDHSEMAGMDTADDPDAGHGDGHGSGETSSTESGEESGGEAVPAAFPGGLMVSQDGYTLRLDRTELEAGRDVPISLTILDEQGEAVTEFDTEHDKKLHLIAVRRDATGFQHVHPVMDDRGTWRTTLDLRPGAWRIFADMKPTAGDKVTLGADLAVAGDYRPVTPAQDVRTTSVPGGYTVSVAGDLTAGEEAELRLTVERDGRPVTDLDPYLGAYGHLVALREGDLAYLHVHPDGAPGDGETEPGPEVRFYAEVPSAGSYQLFLDFKHDGVVRTAPLALTAATAATAVENGEASDAPDPGNDSDQKDQSDGDEGGGSGEESPEDGHSH